MGIAALAAELQTAVALQRVKARVDEALGRRAGLAQQLTQGVFTPGASDSEPFGDVVIIDGRVRTPLQAVPQAAPLTNWADYFRLDGPIVDTVVLLLARVAQLEARLDELQRQQERRRVSAENAIALGYVFSADLL